MSFLVYQYADTVLDHLFVELLLGGGVVEGVGETVATALFDAHSEADLEEGAMVKKGISFGT